MGARICTKCKRSKGVNDFYFDKSKNKPASRCKECQKGQQKIRSKIHYDNNKQYYYERNKRHKSELATIIRDLKHNKNCLDCKRIYPYWVMDFDHRDGSDKEANISRMATEGYTLAHIMEEIAKCDLVCANCHRDRTHLRQRGEEGNKQGEDNMISSEH